jgi:flagellar biosynthesis protein FlhA
MAEFRKAMTWLRNSDILIAVVIITIIAMLIIPIPTALLDVGIALNIAFTLIVILTVIYINNSTEFSVFPTLILFTTLFRIALNVSSTRLILLEGKDFNGQLIHAFGDFVVGGNYVIGIVIFLILVAVQVMVITKGATRVSEVAARFTLDALPGKQMEITNELSANLISEQEAKEKKKAIQKEANFYGAMDGASKFVQGDVRLGIIIIIINIVGGVSVGLIQQGLTFNQAWELFVKLTIGDGLVTQIPSLLMSVATGVIVTRSVSDGSLGNELAKEITYSHKPLYITSGFLLFLAFLPGFPTITILVLALLIGGSGYYISINGPLNKEKADQKKEEAATEASEEEDIFKLINIEPMELEIGFGLIPLVDPAQGGDLLERIKLIRKTMALELGMVVPPIRIRDNMRLAVNDYIIKIKGIEMGSGVLRIDYYLAIPPGPNAKEIKGIEGMDPIFKTPAIWIKEEDRNEAQKEGYSVVDCPAIIATHLTEIFRNSGYELLGRQEVKKILDSIREQNGVIVSEAEKVGIGEIQKIFQNLLRDGVSIRNITTILEVIIDTNSLGIKNTDIITERVRAKLGKQIVQQYVQANNIDVLQVLTLAPEWENVFDNNIQETETQYYANVPPQMRTQFLQQLGRKLEILGVHVQPCIVCSDKIRFFIKELIRSTYPKIRIFSYNELAGSEIKLDHLGHIEFEDSQIEADAS